MLSSVLKSDRAIKISIQIIDAFISMRKFILSNAQIFQRLDFVEKKQIEYGEKFDELLNELHNKNITPNKGIFFDGQIFDAYAFVSDIIRSAKHSIFLVGNYVDDSVLTMFCKTKKNIKVTIFTNNISAQLMLDLSKYNSQYNAIKIKKFNKSHDRFIIIDEECVYHFGASLKDLGKKWFAFSKFEKETFGLLENLGLK